MGASRSSRGEAKGREHAGTFARSERSREAGERARVASAREMLLDLVHGKLDQVLVDFGAQSGPQIM